MEFITLGKTDLKVSRIGFGGCPMGRYGWGTVEESEIIAAVNTAIDCGVNFFDTADIYGIGESEIILGKALKQHRMNSVIATKFGVRRDAAGNTFYDNSSAWLEQALKASLRRLNTDFIDLYQIHYLDGKTPLATVCEALEKQKKAGKIRYYGLSNITLRQIEGTQLPTEAASFQLEFSLAKRDNEAEIAKIQKGTGLTFISWGSLGQGILSGRYCKETRFAGHDRRSRPIYANFYGEKLEQNLKIVSTMKEISSATGKTLPQIALRWILDRVPNSAALTGIKRPAQILENIGASGWKLLAPQMKILDDISNL